MMSRKRDIDIEEDKKFLTLFAKVERVGWVLMLVLISLAVLGFTGDGIFNSQTKESNDLRVNYGLVLRRSTADEIEINTNSREIAFDKIISVVLMWKVFYLSRRQSGRARGKYCMNLETPLKR